MAGATLTAIGSTASQVSGTDGTFEMMVSPYTKFVEASKEGYITAQAEVDGSYLVFKLQVDKKYAENKAKAEEEARKAAEAEKARLAEEAEVARLAAEAAERARLEAEERKRIEEERRIAAEKAAAEKAERDRLAAEAKAKAEEEKRIAAEKAAAEKAEAAKRAAEEKARIAEEKRIAAEKAAAEKAEKARLAAEEKKRIEEEKRIAAEKAAAEKAERQRIAAEEKSKQSAVKASKEDDGSRLAKQEEAKAKVWQEAELRGYRSQVEFAFAMDGELMPYYNIHYIGGYQINNYFYVGAGVGLSIYGAEDVNYNSKYNSKGVGKEQLKLETLNYPVFAYFRANFIDNRCAPFFALSAGYRFGTSRLFRMPWGREADMNYKTSGMFVNPQFGLNLRMTKKMDIYFAVGYNLSQMPAAIYSPAVVTNQGEESRYPRVSLGSKFCHGFDLRLGFTF